VSIICIKWFYTGVTYCTREVKEQISQIWYKMVRFSYSRKQGFLSGTQKKKQGNNDFSSDHMQSLP